MSTPLGASSNCRPRAHSVGSVSGRASAPLCQTANGVSSASGRVLASQHSPTQVQGIAGRVSRQSIPSTPSSPGGAAAGSSAAPNIAVSAVRTPNIAVTAQRVQRSVAPVFVSTHALGTTLQRTATEELHAELQERFNEVQDHLIGHQLIGNNATGVRVHFERCVVSYIDEAGQPCEKSILPEMEANPEFNELVESLARCAREIQGKPGYATHALKDMAKRPGAKTGSPIFKRSGSYAAYQQKKTELANLRKLPKPSGNQRKAIERLEDEISTFTLHEFMPNTIDTAKGSVQPKGPLTQLELNSRLDKAKDHLSQLSKSVEDSLSQLDNELKAAKTPTGGAAVDADAVKELERKIKELKAFKASLDEVDQFALSMALAHSPKGANPSLADLSKAASDLRAATERYYKDKIHEHQQLRGDKLPHVDHYQKDYANDVGALLFSLEKDEEARVLYSKYCETHGISMKASDMTHVILRLIIDEENGVADAKDKVLSSLNQDVKDIVKAGWTPPPSAAHPAATGTATPP